MTQRESNTRSHTEMPADGGAAIDGDVSAEIFIGRDQHIYATNFSPSRMGGS